MVDAVPRRRGRLRGVPEAVRDVQLGNPQEIAKLAGLRYVSDTGPGIRRFRAGRGFRYVAVDGRPLSADQLERVRTLVIPPAWTDVWIAPTATGHIQATGRDARGRKQYIYHPDWRRVRDETKYHRMEAFGVALPLIRERVEHDISLHRISRERVLATLVRLLDLTAIRVGNEEYVRENQSYGLTTLRTSHATVHGSTLRLHFRTKGGTEIALAVKDRRVAAMVRRLQDLPGQELFRFRDENGELRPIESHDVNQYLGEVTGDSFTAKDFRTWTATVVTAEALVRIGEASSATQTKRNLNQAIDEAARRLGNTRAVCRKSYVHPAVISAYEEAWLTPVWLAAFEAPRLSGLHPEEAAVLGVLAHADSLKANLSRKAG